MAKPELGTKRLCAGCNVKFYDLHKIPIVCPTCQTVFVLPKPVLARPRRVYDAPASVTVVPVTMVPVAPPLDAVVAVDNTDGDKPADAGVPLLEEMDED